jgi:hypothetical protein
VFPHCQHTGHTSLQHLAGGGHVPIGTVITSVIVNLAGGLAAAFVASSLRAWLKALLSDLLLPVWRCCFSSWSLTLLMNNMSYLPLDQGWAIFSLPWATLAIHIFVEGHRKN